MLSNETLNETQLTKFIKLVKQDYPNFNVKHIKSIKSGWDNYIIEINNLYIFRFPKSENFKLDKEIKILKRLNGKITLDIPVYEFIGRATPYVGYKKIIGQPLTRDVISQLGIKESNELANDIAVFFNEFHRTLPIKIVRQLGINKNGQQWRHLIIKERLTGRLKNKELSTFIEFILDKYLQFNKNNKNLIIAYNDLHGNNMAFDKKRRRLSGIFDFSDVGVADVNREFCSLFSLDQKLTYKIIKRYEKLSESVIDMEKVFVYSVIDSASILSIFIDKPSSKNYKHALNNLLYLKKISSRFNLSG